MDFKQLEAFVKVIELASFSKAAEELYISQPSVSNYITSLEKELDTVLINRSTKTLSATLAGERFLNKAREMLSLRRESSEMLKNLSEEVSGDIRILASSAPSQYILPPLLAGFHKLYPSISFVMRQADTAKVVRGIAEHKADIGFAGSIMVDKKCSFFELAEEELVFIASCDDSYSATKKYTLEELLYNSNFIEREAGSGTRIQYEKFFTENGIQLDKVKTCASMDSTYSIINAVINGLGISIVSELSVHHMIVQNMLKQIRLNTLLPKRKIYTVLNKNVVHTHLTELFLLYLKGTLKSNI